MEQKPYRIMQGSSLVGTAITFEEAAHKAHTRLTKTRNLDPKYYPHKITIWQKVDEIV